MAFKNSRMCPGESGMLGGGRLEGLVPLALHVDLVAVVVDHHGGLGALEDHAVAHGGEAGPPLRVEGPREDEVRVFADHLERVGSLGQIVDAPAPSGRRDAFRRLQVERPVGDVRVVAPEVDQVAARVIPEIAVGEVRAQRVVGPLGRGPQPEIVVQLRRRSGIVGLAEISVPGGERAIHAMNIPQRARADHFHHAPISRQVVVNVVAHLRDALVPAGRGDHGAAFADGVREGLLDEDVLACLAGMDDRHRVPVIGSRYHHGIEVFALDQLAKVLEFGGSVPLCLLDQGRGAVQVRAVDIADRRGGHIGVAHEFVEAGGALAAQADEAHLNPVARRRRGSGFADSRQAKPRGRQLHEGPSAGFRHLQSGYVRDNRACKWTRRDAVGENRS